MGRLRFVVFYVAGGFAAALTQAVVTLHWAGTAAASIPNVGASGAIAAVIGAYVLLFPNQQPKPWGPIPANIARPLHLTIAWVGLNLAMGFVGPGLGIGIAIWSHIGGFIVGLLLARPLLLWRYRKA